MPPKDGSSDGTVARRVVIAMAILLVLLVSCQSSLQESSGSRMSFHVQ